MHRYDSNPFEEEEVNPFTVHMHIPLHNITIIFYVYFLYFVIVYVCGFFIFEKEMILCARSDYKCLYFLGLVEIL